MSIQDFNLISDMVFFLHSYPSIQGIICKNKTLAQCPAELCTARAELLKRLFKTVTS